MATMWSTSAYRKKRARGLRWRRVWLLVPLCLLLLAALELTLAPLIEVAALQQTHNLALTAITEAVERQSAALARTGDYQQLMHVERDSAGRVTLLVPDTMLLNEFTSALALDVADSLQQVGDQRLSLPLGAVSGSRLLSALGPELPFSFRAHGAPRVSVQDDFTSAGINQVRHRIWLNISSELRVYVPLTNSVTEVQTTVLLAEGVIVGYTPDTYISIGGAE